jgi:hypothetical protein
MTRAAGFIECDEGLVDQQNMLRRHLRGFVSNTVS